VKGWKKPRLATPRKKQKQLPRQHDEKGRHRNLKGMKGGGQRIRGAEKRRLGKDQRNPTVIGANVRAQEPSAADDGPDKERTELQENGEIRSGVSTAKTEGESSLKNGS